MLSSGECAKIEAIQVEQLTTPETTYNFEVEDFHTYYVGAGVLVHNVGCNKVKDVVEDAKEFLGGDAKIVTNKNGDKVFLSNDGTRKLRFDINNPTPHNSSHAHVEIKNGNRWKKSGPIFPIDV